MWQFLTRSILVQENMTRMLMVTDVQDIIKRHQAQIITSLKDPDIRLHVSSYVLTMLIIYGKSNSSDPNN